MPKHEAAPQPSIAGALAAPLLIVLVLFAIVGAALLSFAAAAQLEVAVPAKPWHAPMIDCEQWSIFYKTECPA